MSEENEQSIIEEQIDAQVKLILSLRNSKVTEEEVKPEVDKLLELKNQLPETVENAKKYVNPTVEVQMHDLEPTKEDYPELPDIRTINNTKDTVGLDDELSPEEMERILLIVEDNMVSNDYYNEDKNLDEDIQKLSGQNFAIISYTGPTMTAKTDTHGLRIMGIFETIEEAQDHVDQFEQSEKMFDTAVVELYKFLPSYPSITGETQEDLDSFLNSIIIEYKRQREIASEKYIFRKEKLMENKNRFIEKNEMPEVLPEIQVKQVKKTEQKVVPRNETHARLIAKLEARKNSNKDQKVKNVNLVLKKCDTRVEGQNYVAICFVGHSGKNNRVAMKIKGAFREYEECEKYCKELMQADDTYDIFVSEMYSWIPCDPDIEKIEQVHSDSKLNEMFSATKKETNLTSKFHQEKAKTTTLSEKEVMSLMGGGSGGGPSMTPSSILESLESKDPVNFKHGY